MTMVMRMAPGVILVIVLCSGICSEGIVQMSKVSENKSSSVKFDHFVFAQQWPMSVCHLANISHEHKCVIPKNITSWTIHGLWPTEGTTMQPNFCNNQSKFDINKLKTILSQLGKLWPNLYSDTQWESFWEHEWTKHGTCASTVSSLSDELHYFNQTLQLHDKYNLLSMFGESDVKPSRKTTYQYDDLHTALDNKALIMCFEDKSQQVQYMTSVELCLDKNFSFMKCSDYQEQGMSAQSQGHLRRSRRSVYAPPQESNHHYREIPCNSLTPIVYLPLTV